MILKYIASGKSDYSLNEMIVFCFSDGPDRTYRNFIEVTPGETTITQIVKGLRDLADCFERRSRTEEDAS